MQTTESTKEETKTKSIGEWQKEIHALARSKGWYEGRDRQPLEYHMLFVSEIAEATEAVRVAAPDVYYQPSGKPEGESIELVDTVIRILDYFELRGWDMEKLMTIKHHYNQTRSHRHGGKSV
jgi:hypothetical protein